MFLDLFTPEVEKSKEFKEGFWEWFDNLPQKDRDYYNYKLDSAKIRYFSTVYRHNIRV